MMMARKCAKDVSVSRSPKLAYWNAFQYHKTNITKNFSSLHWEICINRTDLQMVVVVSLGALPDIKNQTCSAAYLVPPRMDGQ